MKLTTARKIFLSFFSILLLVIVIFTLNYISVRDVALNLVNSELTALVEGPQHMVEVIYSENAKTIKNDPAGLNKVVLDEAKKEFASYKIYKTGYVYILDKDGNFILHPSRAGQSAMDLKDTNGYYFIKDIVSKKNGILQYMWADTDGKIKEKIVAFKHIPETDWIIAGGSFLYETFEPVYTIRDKMIAMGGALVILALLLSFFIGRSIMKPINAINEGLRLMVEKSLNGDLQYRADEKNINFEFRPIIVGINKVLNAIVEPINEAVGIMKKVSEGDLREEMKGEYKGDHALLKNSINHTIKSMNDTLTNVNISVDQVDSGAGQVAQASQSLSQGATESASSLEEITSSMNEIGSQTKQNAENSSSAKKLSEESKQSAQKGNEQMQKMVEAMSDINTSSEKISKIIKVIDEIAFQTNLLALNAAVEAARAGKHGKGFSVVAEEVRNLAARSAKAAKETTEMIEDSLKKVQVGTSISKGTATALTEILDGTNKVTGLVTEISNASNEQA